MEVTTNTARMTQRQRKSSNTQKPRTAKPLTLYLFSYNTLSALLWLRVFLGVLTALDLWNVLWLPNGRKLESVHANAVRVYGSLETWLRWTQTLQLIEVIHAAIGKFHVSAIMEKCTLYRTTYSNEYLAQYRYLN